MAAIVKPKSPPPVYNAMPPLLQKDIVTKVISPFFNEKDNKDNDIASLHSLFCTSKGTFALSIHLPEYTKRDLHTHIFLKKLIKEKRLPPGIYVYTPKGNIDKRTLENAGKIQNLWPYTVSSKGQVVDVYVLQGCMKKMPFPAHLQVHDEARGRPMPLILQVIRFGSVAQLQRVLTGLSNPNANATGLELYWAVKRNDITIVETLVNAGVRFQTKKDYNEAVAIARANRNPALVEKLPPFAPPLPHEAKRT